MAGVGKYKRKPKGKRGFKMKSPFRHKPWAEAHREKVAHDGTAEAHGAKPKPPKKGKPTKAAYGSKDQGGGVQTREEYLAEINAK